MVHHSIQTKVIFNCNLDPLASAEYYLGGTIQFKLIRICNSPDLTKIDLSKMLNNNKIIYLTN